MGLKKKGSAVMQRAAALSQFGVGGAVEQSIIYFLFCMLGIWPRCSPAGTVCSIDFGRSKTTLRPRC